MTGDPRDAMKKTGFTFSVVWMAVFILLAGSAVSPVLGNPIGSNQSTVIWENPHLRCCPVNIQHLVVRFRRMNAPSWIPASLSFRGVNEVEFRFLGTEKFFVGVLVVATGSKDRIIHHGLFDQGPIDEVLTRTFFGKVERVRVAGIFDRDGTKYLVLERIRTKKEAWIPLSSALFALLSSIGKQSDLSWGVS